MSKITWIKLAIDMFDDEKIKIIDSMSERNLIHYVWTRLLIQAGKTNAKGNIFLNENIPYTKEMLSIIFNRSIHEVELSLKVLSDLRMIEIDENNFVSILNWEKHQNIEGMEKIREQTRKRVEKLREKQKIENDIPGIENIEKQKLENGAAGTEDRDNAEEIKHMEDNEEEVKHIEYNDNSKDDKNNADDYLANKKNSSIISDIKSNKNHEEKSEISCNVTVTEQTKRENKKEIKKENKTESKKKNKTNTENMSNTKSDVKNKNMKGTVCLHSRDSDTEESEALSILSLNKNKNSSIFLNEGSGIGEGGEGEDISEDDIEKYIKNLKVNIIGGSLSAMKLAASTHGIVNVKLAVEMSLEANKPRMSYINGILTNWKREGYPSNNSKIGHQNFQSSYNKKKVLSFNNFEPRKYDYNALEKALLGW